MPFPTPPWRREGQDPDYRFSFANERTFLAWVRTALALVMAAVLLHELQARHGGQALAAAASALLALLGALLGGLAYLRWKSNEQAMRHAASLPHSSALVLLACLAVLGGTAGGVLLLLQWAR